MCLLNSETIYEAPYLGPEKYGPNIPLDIMPTNKDAMYKIERLYKCTIQITLYTFLLISAKFVKYLVDVVIATPKTKCIISKDSTNDEVGFVTIV